jgi:three-Cys-motif partner protein
VNRFGGDWTDEKLRHVEEYLRAYATALKNQPFRLAYIDAFAGTGYREIESPDLSTPYMFPDFEDEDSRRYVAGSAQIALECEPRFDKFVFIERDAQALGKLEQLGAEYPHLEDDITLVNEDANAWLKRMCDISKPKLRKFWSTNRAVAFLDPFGMQVEWETIKAIASTKAIDVWVLFPLGVAVNRLLTKSGEIPNGWQTRLNKIFGTEDWYDEFYDIQENLFGEGVPKKVTNMARIGEYYNERLSEIFSGVTENPKPLYNKSGNPIYLLCFAVGNPRAEKVALGIAQHILNQ